MLLSSLAIGTYLVIKGKATVGILIASIQLMDIIDMAVLDFTYEIIDLKSIKLVNKKILDIIGEEIPNEEGIEKQSFNNSIEFKDVCFSYDENKEVLKDINFSIKKGDKYAIVGQSDSGKSTMLKLLLRYYTEYKGNIYIDKVDSRDLKLSNLYRLVSTIDQDIFMFDATIKDNICLYKDYTDKQLSEAIQFSGLRDIINKTKGGINAFIGEDGSKLSGGEKQRIAIARAIIKHTPILLLDEATSSLDNETACKIETSVLNLQDITAFVVTHRLSEDMLKHYDKILVMRDGVLQEIGSFEELMDNKAYFYNLFNIESNPVKEKIY